MTTVTAKSLERDRAEALETMRANAQEARRCLARAAVPSQAIHARLCAVGLLEHAARLALAIGEPGCALAYMTEAHDALEAAHEQLDAEVFPRDVDRCGTCREPWEGGERERCQWCDQAPDEGAPLQRAEPPAQLSPLVDP